eukprot:1147206-Prymnesium_polylepis.1
METKMPWAGEEEGTLDMWHLIELMCCWCTQPANLSIQVSAPVMMPVRRRTLTGPTEELSVTITCPHCGGHMITTAANANKNKSNICRAHLARHECDKP